MTYITFRGRSSKSTPTTDIQPGNLVTVHVRRDPFGNTNAYTGIVWRNRGPELDLDITEDGRTRSGWSWNIIERVEKH